MPDGGVQKKVGHQLPNIKPPRDVPGNQSEKMIKQRRIFRSKNQFGDRLNEKYAGARDDDVADRGRQHASPTDARTGRARISRTRTHYRECKRGEAGSQSSFGVTLRSGKKSYTPRI